MKSVVKKNNVIKKKDLQRESKNQLILKVYNQKGEKFGKIDLPSKIFSLNPNIKLIAQYIRVYLTNQRQGNASTKTRGEVSGSTRKIYRQKGTGRARHGDIKAPIFVGGGIVGGPKTKVYFLKINKKQKQKALFSSLSLKYKEGNITCLNNDCLKIIPKTNNLHRLLFKIGLSDKKVLLVLPKLEKNNLMLASRNLPNISLTDSLSLNAYTILNSEKLIFIEKSLEVLTSHFLKNEN